MAENMNNCLKMAQKLPIVVIIKKRRAKISEFFYKHNLKGKSMTAQVTPLCF